jgi:hypothetical protein
MESLEVSNLLIVESHNDKFFIEALSGSLTIDIKVNQPICQIDDYECLEGLSETKLYTCLNDVKFDDYTKIGIVIDADKEGIKNRLALIDSVVKKFDDTIEIKNINTPIRSDKLDLEFICYITNVDGQGELETLLKTVKSKNSTYADCLDAWRECLKTNNKEISDKDFDKFWVSNYLKFDTCISSRDRGKKSKYCSNEILNYDGECDMPKIILESTPETIRKPIWNFEHEALSDLKAFLQLF